MKKLFLLTLCALGITASLPAAQGGRDTKTTPLTKKQKAAAAAKEREDYALMEAFIQQDAPERLELTSTAEEMREIEAAKAEKATHERQLWQEKKIRKDKAEKTVEMFIEKVGIQKNSNRKITSELYGFFGSKAFHHLFKEGIDPARLYPNAAILPSEELEPYERTLSKCEFERKQLSFSDFSESPFMRFATDIFINPNLSKAMRERAHPLFFLQWQDLFEQNISDLIEEHEMDICVKHPLYKKFLTSKLFIRFIAISNHSHFKQCPDTKKCKVQQYLKEQRELINSDTTKNHPLALVFLTDQGLMNHNHKCSGLHEPHVQKSIYKKLLRHAIADDYNDSIKARLAELIEIESKKIAVETTESEDIETKEKIMTANVESEDVD